jgi:hypothetical protein
MANRMIDGGYNQHSAGVASPARDARSADRSERDASDARTPPRAAQAPGATPTLSAAAVETNSRVAAATTARQNADAMQALPPATRRSLGGEMAQARTEANQADAAATRAASDELRIAKQVLTPAQFDRYADDLASEQPHAAVAKAVQQAKPPAPAVSAAADPLQAALDKANRAQANYESLNSSGGPSDSYNTYVIKPAQQQADAAWKEVDALVSQDLQRSSGSSQQVPHIGSSTVESRAANLTARAPDNTRFTEIVNNAAARTSGGAIAADVASTYHLKGADAAAARLDELTTTSSPEIAREAIIAAQPTMDAIGADLGGRAGAADPVNVTKDRRVVQNPHSPGYDRTVQHLSNVAYLASQAQGGEAAVKVVAQAVAKHVDSKNIGRLDEALGNSVRQTGAATLSIAVADQLQLDIDAGSGRKANQADDVLQNVQQGLVDLRKDTAAAAGNLANDKAFRLISGYTEIKGTKTVDKKDVDPAGALRQHFATHPDEEKNYKDALAALDRQGLAALRAQFSTPNPNPNVNPNSTLTSNLPPSLQGLEHGKKLIEERQAFDADGTMAFALSTSRSAGAELDRMVVARGDKGESFVANAATSIGLAKSVQESIGSLYIKTTLEKAYAQVRDNKVDDAVATLDSLKNKGKLFGVDDVKVNKAIDALKANVTAAGADGVTPDLLKAQAKQLDKDLASAGFDADTTLGKTLRVVGISMSICAFVKSAKAVFTDGTDPGEVLQATVAGAGLGKDGAEFFAKDAALLKSAGWKLGGVALAGFGVAMDVVSLGGHLSDGKLSDAGLDGLSAVGGGLGIWATLSSGAALGGWAGPIGLGLVALAAAGKFGLAQYRHVHDANLLENGATQAYLVKMGFNEKVSYHLRNADENGRSVMPALADLAKSYGYNLNDPIDAQKFVDYINSFEKSDHSLAYLGQLVEAAHHVNRRDDGSLQQDLTSDEKYVLSQASNGNFLMYPESIDSMAGLRVFLEQQAARSDGVFATPQH